MAELEKMAELQTQIKVLREAYAARLPQRIDQINETWNEISQGKWDLLRLEDIHMQIHKLTGSGASYGFLAISDIARNLEAQLSQLLQLMAAPLSAQVAEIDRLLVDLKLASQEARRPAIAIEPLVFDSKLPSLAKESEHTIFIIESDLEAAFSLSEQIGYFGYKVEVFPTLKSLEPVLEQRIPTAIITDIMFPDNELAGTKAVAQVLKARTKSVPIIFLSNRGDMMARLQAVRAGGFAYFTRPIDISGLIDKLDTLTNSYRNDPYRLLIVEDELELAEFYSFHLKSAGMVTSIVTNPLKVMPPLMDFSPDLILMDVYMPRCSGLELAKVVRQQEAYVSVPIVFLSAETDLEKQLKAMQLGGDDFLTKLIQPDHLISSVAARAERSRVLRSLMVRDGLTGLLTHTKAKEQLDVEVARVRRRGGVLSLAMIDLDHFKTVNDTYGHMTGDRVLKSLARLLQQRLRKTDIIGRYGGEEFVAVLVDTDPQAALQVLDEIREGFSLIQHQSEDIEFRVSFSCGVASFPQYEDAVALNDAADKALYEAKHAGRNRVILAGNYLF
jgi:diguanylate cyclase (GGDEF)-like protein